MDSVEEKKYPIYTVSAKWIQDGEQDPEWPHSWEGLPPGRIRNSSGWDFMRKEEIDIEAETARIREEFSKHEKYKDVNMTDLEITIELRHYETWCLGWFHHWTFDEGQDDGQILMSFERFVQRMELFNAKHRYETGERLDKYCLMGAEDRWRWRGADTEEGEQTEAPCRCEGCKKNGVIRIDH